MSMNVKKGLINVIELIYVSITLETIHVVNLMKHLLIINVDLVLMNGTLNQSQQKKMNLIH